MKIGSLLAVLIACVTPLTAIAQSATPKLLPLGQADIMPGCGCRFATSSRDDAPLLLHWSWVGDKQAVLRDAKSVYRLNLRNERYMPSQRTPPQYGDRMILFFADGQWQIQVLGSVTKSCRPTQRSCSGTDYKGRLVVQYEGGEQTSTDVWGHCGC